MEQFNWKPGGRIELWTEKDEQGRSKFMKVSPSKFELLIPNTLVRDVMAFGEVGTEHTVHYLPHMGS